MNKDRISAVLNEIRKLKIERNAVVLAHYYQTKEVKEVADFIGDSLELSKKALRINSDIIVFAGVSFMAEMAAVLNPEKIVLHPDINAGCPLADFITPGLVLKTRKENPGVPIILYVNSPIEAKALADYVVTSSSAEKLIRRIGSKKVVFGPDKNLADYVAKRSGVEVIPLPPDGHCYVHERLISKGVIEEIKSKHPKAKLLVHPETSKEVRDMADFIGSTSQMIKAIGELEGKEFIIGTEEGLSYDAKRNYPDKKVIPIRQAVCEDMKKITPEKILSSLRTLSPKVIIDEEVAERARRVIERSLQIIG
ncbi:MAG: quinolinate synthase NadA [Caldisphaeraceae archaeon]|nr:quinolinate synthase NadA [Caldisphaeraceae archaeon]